MKTIKKQIQELMLKITQSSFEIAIKTYPNLSSFAIVTDEDLTCFDIAINENLFFADMIAGKATDEDFWNTAEWKEELYCENINHLKTDLYLLNNLTDELSTQLYDDDNYMPNIHREFTTEYDTFFLTSCCQALASIRKPQNQAVNMFVHVTDFTFHSALFKIVEALNSQEICQSYLAYYN